MRVAKLARTRPAPQRLLHTSQPRTFPPGRRLRLRKQASLSDEDKLQQLSKGRHFCLCLPSHYGIIWLLLINMRSYIVRKLCGMGLADTYHEQGMEGWGGREQGVNKLLSIRYRSVLPPIHGMKGIHTSHHGITPKLKSER